VEPVLVLTHDIGTTGNKACLYRIGDTLDLIGSEYAEYPHYTTPDGGVEQKAEDWWTAVCGTTRSIIERTRTPPQSINGISFCCQMQGSVHVDAQGRAIRNPMIYIDGRATAQFERVMQTGLVKISGLNAWKALRSLHVTGGVAGTSKDPLWKYHWVRENEPELFAKTHKWLDVKDYLLLRCTGRYAMTQDSAHVTFIYDTRPGKLGWHKGLCHMFGVDMNHLPPVILSTDRVGGLTAAAAAEMGLAEGTAVFGGGGDASLIPVGAGCLKLYDTHFYVGTSGWAISNVDRRMVDISNFIASILGAIPGRYNYVAEQETSGYCLQWAREQLVRDGVDAYDAGTEPDSAPLKISYDILNRAVEGTPPGADGIIFTPWFHGNRAPREDPYARGVFFNLGFSATKPLMLRAVMEGVAFHKRWMLEALERNIPRRDTVRFVGGGARSGTWCQIMADVTGRNIQTVATPQDAGAMGAAVVCAVGLGRLKSFEEAEPLIPFAKTFVPRPEFKHGYDRSFEVFKAIYARNKKLFHLLNRRH
jgi:xylulokinase